MSCGNFPDRDSGAVASAGGQGCGCCGGEGVGGGGGVGQRREASEDAGEEMAAGRAQCAQVSVVCGRADGMSGLLALFLISSVISCAYLSHAGGGEG